MAKFKLKKIGSNAWTVTARYQPFKGAATRQKTYRGSREEVPAMMTDAATWVNSQRRPEGSA